MLAGHVVLNFIGKNLRIELALSTYSYIDNVNASNNKFLTMLLNASF